MDRTPLIAVLLLSGCPYVFGGPDLSNVPGVPSDTADTDDTPVQTGDTAAADTDTAPMETGDTAVGTPGPEVSSLTVELRTMGAALAFVVDDADGDLEGGTVSVTDGTTTIDFLIPDDLVQWEVGGTSVVAWLDDDPCDGITLDLELTVTDVAGNTSQPLSGSVLASGAGTLPEIGYQTDMLGLVALPLIVCGVVDQPFDQDSFRFVLPSDGDHTFTLTWEGSSDLGLSLYDTDGVQLALADQIGLNLQPEVMDVQVPGGTPLELRVEHWINPLAPLWVVLLEGP